MSAIQLTYLGARLTRLTMLRPLNGVVGLNTVVIRRIARGIIRLRPLRHSSATHATLLHGPVGRAWLSGL